MVYTMLKNRLGFVVAVAASSALCMVGSASYAATRGWEGASSSVVVPVSRSELVTSKSDIAQVLVADQEIADVYAHGTNAFSVIGKKMGRTTIRAFDKDGKELRVFDVSVGYDLPAIRRALKSFLPDEQIAVDMVGNNIALTGQISNASVADKAVRIASEFIKSPMFGGGELIGAGIGAGSGAGAAAPDAGSAQGVLNLLEVVSGQQVVLRVRIGEVKREALKTLGVDLNAVNRAGGNLFALGTGGGIGSLVAPSSSSDTSLSFGQFLLPGGRQPTNTRGLLYGRWQPNGGNGDTLAGAIKALEQDGLFKLLAEPNLTAVSGEQAEFLAGGEIPVPVPQSGGTGGGDVAIEYKTFGVAVRFKPYVLSENRIRVEVQPEVSELDQANAVTVGGVSVPALTTRRAKTTVELAPGESFMIAGLIRDQARGSISQLPGVKDLPVLGALFRSTEFQRSETELVIAVTPYVVDPVKSSDIKFPTDNFAPASQMDMFFYGALGAVSNARGLESSPVEGPAGFMVD